MKRVSIIIAVPNTFAPMIPRKLPSVIRIMSASRISSNFGTLAEKELSKAISSTHYVSYAIYATVAQRFLTTDRRFFVKCSAVYYYLGIPTKIVFAERNTITVELDKLIAEFDIN